MKKIIILCIITLLIVGCNKKEESATFSLYGNPTTGYDWTCKVKEDIVSIEMNFTQDNEELMGSGGIYEFTLKPLKDGEAKLTCIYKREWEETDSDETKTYEVSVKNKKVTIKNK